MRIVFAAVVALLVVLGLGLLPPVFARSSLDQATLEAARAGSEQLQGGGISAADAAAIRSIAAHPSIRIVSMGLVAGTTLTFEVTTNEHVQTFMDRIPGLTGWFLLASTQRSTLGN
jgi:hypothetical protein